LSPHDDIGASGVQDVESDVRELPGVQDHPEERCRESRGLVSSGPTIADKGHPAEPEHQRQAAIHKIGQPKLSLADCFALATCEDKAEVLLTTDSELKVVGGKNTVLIPVEKSAQN
jgi:hypothetical protein